LCNTLRAGTDSARGAHTSPRPIHPYLARVITVREAARLHSYPDWFHFHKTKWHGFRQIGNSVPPLLARAVARELLRAQRILPVLPKQVLNLGQDSLLSFDMSAASDRFQVPRDTIAQRTRRVTVLDSEKEEAYV
jgi:DNA (cytosine-5)-methyltransferase 1